MTAFRLRYGFLVLGLVAIAAPMTFAESFTFTAIATCGPVAAECLLGQRPAINNSGTVAYWVQGNGSNSIIASNGVTSTTIATSSGNGLGNPDINNNGLVAYPVLNGGGNASVLAGDGTTTTVISGPSQRTLGDGLSINDAGVVAFFQSLAGNVSSVIASDGTTTTTIASNSSAGGISFDQGVAIDSSGLVAFQASLNGGGESVFTGNGGALTTVATTSGNPTFSGVGGASISDTGSVIGWAGQDYNNVSDGVFTNAGGLSTVADIGNFPGYSSALDGNVNDNGDAAFLLTGNAGSALFFDPNGGPASLSDFVVGTGDSLFGLTVSDVLFFNNGLNDNGQLVFWASLGSPDIGGQSETAIIVATPAAQETSVPEPATLLLLGSGLLFGWRRRRSR